MLLHRVWFDVWLLVMCDAWRCACRAAAKPKQVGGGGGGSSRRGGSGGPSSSSAAAAAGRPPSAEEVARRREQLAAAAEARLKALQQKQQLWSVGKQGWWGGLVFGLEAGGQSG